MGSSRPRHRRWHLAILFQLFAPKSARAITAQLDEAILSDLLHRYDTHEWSTCGDTANETSFTFEYPGVNPGSDWSSGAAALEEGLFAAMMSHVDPDDSRLSWDIRVGTGGNMYSHYNAETYGETMPPQDDGYAYGTPFVDEVSQTVSVNNDLMDRIGNGNTRFCSASEAAADACPKAFVHQAGAYARDAPYTDSKPFFSPSLARHCEKSWCAFASWGAHAHLPTPWTSPIMYVTKFTNCGGGVIEHTQMIHNFVDPTKGHWPPDVTYDYFNVPWSGVRASNLPHALEPYAVPRVTDGTYYMPYADPNGARYVPICPWSLPPEGPHADRAEIKKFHQTGGWTTFVGEGLRVNREHQMSLPSGFELGVNQSPNCAFHNSANPYTTEDGVRHVALKCHLAKHANFGPTNAYISNPDPCAPWKKARIGFRNAVTGAVLEVSYVRHWSWSASDRLVFFSVFIEDTGSEARSHAADVANGIFRHSGAFVPVELTTVRMSSVEPWCRGPDGTMAESCTDYQIERDGYDRIELAIPPAGPNCAFDPDNAHQGLVGMACSLRKGTGFGVIENAHEETQFRIYRANNGMALDIAYVKHWSLSPDDERVYFSVFTVDDGGPERQAAIDHVNNIFVNWGGTSYIELHIRALSSNADPTPASYDPHSLPTFTYVYGRGGEDFTGVAGYGRRRIGHAIASRDYTVFTTNWMGSGVGLGAGETFQNRMFMFSGALGSVNPTADDLAKKIYIDEIGLEQWNPRSIDVYEDAGAGSFMVKAASSPETTMAGTTTCATSANLVCSGKSTPANGLSPFFYIACGSGTYFGPDPYARAPHYGNGFPYHGNVLVSDSWYKLVCGSSTSGSCPNSSLSAGNKESHAVRCCSDSVKEGWSQNCNDGRSVWGASEIGGACYGAETYEEAEAICASEGARLCTEEELEADCTMMTGCGFDDNMVWSSTEHGLEMTPSYQIVCGSPTSYACKGQKETVSPTVERPVRCCSDTDHYGAHRCTERSVWGASEVNGVCHSAETYDSAVSLCESVGARLCTEEELVAGCTSSTGCGFDHVKVWSAETLTESQQSTGSGDIEMVRAYACRGQAKSARPSWKLMGFFDSDDAGCASLMTSTYDEHLCTIDWPTSSPTSHPSETPSTSLTPSITSLPTSKPTSSPEHEPETTLSYQIVCGSPTSYKCKGQKQTVSPTIARPVRCCSDTNHYGVHRCTDRSVWGASEVGGTCYSAETYDSAVALCESVGARLCTEQELVAGCTSATGCGFDHVFVWSAAMVT